MFTFFLCVMVGFGLSTKGIDLSTATTVDGFSCLIENEYTFAIVRCYRSLGKLDSNCISNIENAWKAGMKNVDAYLFPCPKCGSPKQQVFDTVNHLNNTEYGMLWLDIEGREYWLGNEKDNREFFEGLLEGLKETKVTVGIYSSYYQWESIMGLDYEGGKQFPLWYAHYDNKSSFDDFKPFSGWKTPAIKQYYGDSKVCHLGQVDLDFYT